MSRMLAPSMWDSFCPVPWAATVMRLSCLSPSLTSSTFLSAESLFPPSLLSCQAIGNSIYTHYHTPGLLSSWDPIASSSPISLWGGPVVHTEITHFPLVPGPHVHLSIFTLFLYHLSSKQFFLPQPSIWLHSTFTGLSVPSAKPQFFYHPQALYLWPRSLF